MNTSGLFRNPKHREVHIMNLHTHKGQTLNCKWPILLLSWAGLAFAIAQYIVIATWKPVHVQFWNPPPQEQMNIIPIICFVLYAHLIRVIPKPAVALAVVYATFSLLYVIFLFHISPMIFPLLATAMTIALVIHILKGFPAKTGVILFHAFWLLFELGWFLITPLYSHISFILEEARYALCPDFVDTDLPYLVFIFSSFCCRLCLHVALLLFCFNNRLPGVLPGKQKQIDPYALSAESQLEQLNEKYRLGAISQEEYLAQRAEIIRRV